MQDDSGLGDRMLRGMSTRQYRAVLPEMATTYGFPAKLVVKIPYELLLLPKRRLFVIDGSKALRAAIDAVFGAQNPVQRCRWGIYPSI